MILKSVFKKDYVVHNDTVPVYKYYDIKVYKYRNNSNTKTGFAYYSSSSVALDLSYLYVVDSVVFGELAGLNTAIVKAIALRKNSNCNKFLYDRMLTNYKKARQ